MRNYLKKVWVAFVVLSASISVAAELHPINGILRTDNVTTVTVGTPTAEKEIVAFPSAGSADYNIRNIVSLSFDKSSTHFFAAPKEIKVNVTVKRWDALGVLINPTTTEDLIVTIDNRYDRKTIDKSFLKLSGGYKVNVVINSIKIDGVNVNDLPDYVYVESEIYITRFYQYNGGSTFISAINALNVDCDSNNTLDELEIVWAPINTVEEYQLEWTFVNDYGFTTSSSMSLNSLKADFKGNSTRITTAFNTYKISLTFEKGYIAFRVRGVGRDYLNPDKYIYGNWSSGSSDVIVLSSMPSGALYHNTSAHENKKNWQYSATYAEEGKKKEVISYFDGSLHNRQSVTKINSDNNVIVGETIYDFQGRPAINVLPTPVNFPACTTPSSTAAPSLKYYDKFNQNTSGNSYSKDNFDKDVSSSQCDVAAEPMANTSGSSQYYSGNNPNKNEFQAFVPDADLYPFSQVEYTPDNTGRIRSQSGVGKTFQLGNGHETKYIYSFPNQLQLDRLFGSEVGDASHYKKNTVTDANGQISISYLNQEGKTIATSLAGNPPKSGDTLEMQALTSESGAVATLTVDAFNKDANGNSLLNTITPLQDGVEFATQLSVSYASSYSFDYNLSIDTLSDPCLNNGFCISCIYDLEIKVADECGLDLTPTNAPITRRVGHLSPAPNGYTMSCTSPTGTNVAEAFTVHLTPGVYTISKKLTIDKNARDFYLQKYLDSASGVSHCVKTLNDFVQDALAQIDTMDCYGSCSSCVAALGSKDDFISSGQGTELQWEILLEECMAPCKDLTLCETGYEMMLLDVTPGGQYAKYDATTNTSGDLHSVLNTSNVLNANVGGTPNWHKPKIVLGGNVYEQFLNENGERVKVNLFPSSVNPSGFSPDVVSTSPTAVFTETGTGQKYTYPENLKNLGDFLNVWDPYFAKSLVMYHPEYAYYIACKDQSKKYAGDHRTTDQFDSLLLVTNTFAEAVTNGFIQTTYLSISNPNNRITQWFNHGAGHAYDPFFSNVSAFNSFYGPFTVPYNTSVTYNHAQTVLDMQNKMSNYATATGSTFYSMIEIAALSARCGNNFYSTPTSGCLDFGKDFINNPSSIPAITQQNDSIRNAEWTQLKNFYLSEKRKLQFKRMNHFAKYIINSVNPSQPSSEMLGGCNSCIGEASFNPFIFGFYSTILPSATNPAYDPSQPCSFYTYSLFSGKQKRFVDLNNTGLSTSNIGYQLYLQTGQCPMAFQVQNFLSSIVAGHYLYTGTDINLGGISTFNPDLYTAVNGGVNPSIYINYKWKVTSVTPTILTANIINPTTGVNACTFTFDITGTPIINFTKIVNVQSISFHHSAGGLNYYNLGVGYIDASGSLHSTTIVASSCIDIANCSFQPACTSNTFASDVMNLINVMAANGLSGASNYNMSTNSLIAPLVSTVIRNTLAASSDDMMWNFVSPNKIELYYNGTPAKKLVFTIIGFNPSSALSSTVAYSNIRSNYNNLFKMDALNASGNKIADVDGKAEKNIGGVISGISMGDCGLPENPACDLTEHRVRKDLEKLLNEFLTSTSYTGDVNLFNQANFSTLLRSYLPSSVSSTSSTYTSSGSGETLVFNTAQYCKMELTHTAVNPAANFNHVVAVKNLKGLPPYDAQQNYQNFSFDAVFDTGGSLVTETVYGESCFPLKNCTVCDPVIDTTFSLSAVEKLVAFDSATIATGKGYRDKNWEDYDKYALAIDSLNLRNAWTSSSPEYVNAISYLSYSEKGYTNAEQFIKYIINYDTIVDSTQYLNINAFIKSYGNVTNCKKEYSRYEKAIDTYNHRALVMGANLLTAINDSIFYYNNLCDTIFSYVKYLNRRPQTGGSADDVLVFFGINGSSGGGGGGGGISSPQDSCKIVYNLYVDAYKQFENNATVQQACKEAKILHPLYSFEVIEKNNLCCSYQGVQLFLNYINALLNASTACPPVIQSLKDCSNSDSDVDPRICQRNYIYFTQKINEYNTSAFALANNHTLDINIYPSYYLFQQAGYCNCVIDYINYLNDYVLLPGSASAPLPQDIDHYGGCTHTIYPPTAADTCKKLYATYLSTINAYNAFVKNNPSLNYPPVKVIFKEEQFFAVFCNCAEKYIANLTALMNGLIVSQEEASAMINPENACSKPDCVRIAPDTAFTFPPVPYSQNPCVAELIGVATQNAINAYNQYVDSVTTSFVSRYNTHCLKALENMHYTYDDKEYHFTLYYYDQAGNLIKTVPPEGIAKLPITSDTDALELKIKLDRLNNTQTVYTEHRMATTYEYNSLNQLVRQDMPDHDKMDICESILPNGLDADLTVNGVQMINSNKGYLTGYLTRVIAGNSITRGYVYTTNDGGKNWSKVKTPAGVNIQKVQFVSATEAYAVGDYGMILKTLDGGYSWDVNTNLYSTPYFGILNDLYFNTATTGLVAGITNSSGNGGVFKTTDGGNTFTAATTFAANDTITGLTYDGSYYYASVKNGISGKMYRSNDGLSWTVFSNYSSTNLKKVVFAKGKAYAVGYDGTLLKSDAMFTNYTLQATNEAYKFSDIYFKNNNDGVALIDSVAGMARIYKTFDGGKNWQPLSAPGKYYVSLQLYDAVNAKLLAVGTNGQISKVLINTAPFGVSTVSNTGVTAGYTFADAQTNSGKVLSIGVNNTSTIYINYDINSSAGWTSFNTSPSIPASAGGFKKVLISANVSTSPAIQALLLGNNGVLYGIYKTFSGSPTYAAITTTADNYTDITTKYQNNGLVFYAYESITKKLKRVTFNANAATATVSNLAGSHPTITTTINAIQLNNNADTLLMVGNDGSIYRVRFPGGPSAVWADLKNNVKPLPLNDITAVSAGNIIAVGNNGTYWYSTNANSSSIGNATLQLSNTGTGQKLNAVKSDALSNGLVGGNNGLLYQANTMLSANPNLVNIATSSTSNIADVAINAVNGNAYAASVSGKTFYITGYNSSAVLSQTLATNTSGAQNGVAFTTTGIAYSVGDASTVIMMLAANGVFINDIYTNKVNSAHFYDANNGYCVANNHIIRKTNNGGASWTVILPNTTLPQINKVYATTANKAIVIGNSKYAALINASNTPVILTVPATITTSDFRDIHFNATGYGLIVGSNAWAAKIASSGSSYTITAIGQAAGGGFDFNTVHVFNDDVVSGNKNFIAAGTGGNIYFNKNGTSTGFVKQNYNTVATDVFNDIYFHDDRVGYVVGDAGKALKCVLNKNIGAAGSLGQTTNAIPWASLCPNAIYLNKTASNVNFNAIAFATHTQGFLAGSYNATGNHLHALVLNDESMLYSTRFWYDKLGRMVVSQNTKQFVKTTPTYSYTLYDELGRIKEVGEKYENASLKHKSIFGTNINGLFNSKAIDDTKLLAWINDNTGARKEVTHTFYDAQVIAGIPLTQENLRKRVSTVTYEDVYDAIDSTYQHATHYTYDIHGNVKTLIQDNKKLYDEAIAANSAIINQRYKRTDYEYDLISGKVNQVKYQANQADQFIHKYTYDADNRITKVETSSDNILWQTDAKYFYYAHGPLARVEYGHDKVQGMDYAYTLQGWIKGVNSNTLQTHRDMGVDGDTLLPNPNKNFAKDGFGYTLNYYTGDYKAIDYLKWNSATDRFEASTFGSDLIASRYNLFDGNISSMVTTIVKPTITPGDTVQFVPLPQGTAYKYDQLNRLVEMTAWQNLNAGTNTWDSGLAYAGMYNNKFTYDANGGLLTALAKNQTGTIIDKQIYQHQTLAGERINNRIYAINDSAVVTSGNDLLDQITFDNTALTINSANNYSYTEMGELKSNKQDSIDLITWTLYGKLKSVTRSAGCSKRNVIFDYDAGSNRVAKHIYTSSNEWISSEYYIRNASGEIMSTYKNEVVDSSMSFAQIEKHIYGSNLVGIDKTETEMISALPAPNPFPHTLGNKYYTGNNHLGNVLITFTDRKIPVDLNNDSIIDEYWPDVISSNDYAPFGGALTERTFNKNTFPNSFNGKRDDKELNMQDYGMRPYMQDARFVPTMDPLTKKYPELSPYQFASNNPIWNIDLDGLEGTPYSNLGQSDPNKRAGTYNTDWGFATASSAGQADNQGGRITGTKYYNYSLPWTTLYLWQKPVPRVVTTTNVDPNIPPGNPVNQPPVNVVRNINFNPMSPVLTASGTNQINQIAAMAAPTQVVQNNGAAMPQPPVTTMGVNSEGLPMTTTTQQTIQPVQQITTTSTITVNLSTALAQDANSTALLTARFNAISAQLQAQGIAPGNIIQGTQNFGVAGLQNGNQTNFQINTTTTTANGSQSTTTTTVTDSTYEKN